MLQPRSILQLVLIGFLVVLLPVLAALVYGGRTMSRMSEDHRDDVVNVSESAEHLQKLARDVIDIERLARQYLLLGDDSHLQLLNQHITDMDADFKPFQTRSQSMAEAVRTIRRLKEDLGKRLNEGQSLAQGDAPTLALIDAMNLGLAQLRQQSDRELQAHVEAAKAHALATQKTLIILASTLIPSTLLLVGLFSILITRPIRTIDKTIHEIGTGKYLGTGRIQGPKDLQLLATRLDQLRTRLHSSEESQERFLRHISHELKTPLATIKEGIELLADEVPGPLNDSQRKVLGILQSGLGHFQNLINNLLDFNLMRSDRSLNRVPVAIKDLIEEAIRPYLLIAQRRQLTFETLGPALEVDVDPSVIAAAIDNLLSNAVHFSPVAGKITVQWQSSPRGVTLLVGDEGPGIPPDEWSKVFLPFFQGKAVREGPIKGTGLGLSVARECIESHKGVLSIIESKRGAWFEIYLPQDSRRAIQSLKKTSAVAEERQI